MLMYIDPGTGSMLFAILFGLAGASFYSLKMLFIKLRFWLTGGKADFNNEKIPFVIFSDGKQYWHVFEPICREMDKLGKDVVYMTASDDDPALQNNYSHIKAEFIGKGNRAFAKLNVLNASVLLSTTPGLNVYQWKRSKNVDYYVHVLHAAGEVVLYRMFGLDCYDALLLSGEHQIPPIRRLEELRGLPAKDLKIVGITYMDEMLARLQNSQKPEKKQGISRTVLLAPSWGPSAIFSVYGGRIIDVLLKTGYHIIVRPHPQSFISEKDMLAKLMHDYPESEQFEWNRDNDNFEVLKRSDIMISDFSGIIFDYALIFDKPVIYTNPQFKRDVYDAWWLKEEPLWCESAIPQLGRELTEDSLDTLKDLIDSCLTESCYAEGRERVRDETWTHRGESARLVAEYLVTKYDEIVTRRGA